MTREEREKRADAMVERWIENHYFRIAEGTENKPAHGIRDMLHGAYRLGVKDGQAIALEAQERTKVPA